jgi:hypothetical protein
MDSFFVFAQVFTCKSKSAKSLWQSWRLISPLSAFENLRWLWPTRLSESADSKHEFFKLVVSLKVQYKRPSNMNLNVNPDHGEATIVVKYLTLTWNWIQRCPKDRWFTISFESLSPVSDRVAKIMIRDLWGADQGSCVLVHTHARYCLTSVF